MMKEYVSRFLHWRGWKKIFPLPVWADVLMFGTLGLVLIPVFLNGLEMWWPSYILYVFSAYSLTSLCIKLPTAIRMEKNWLKNHPEVDGFLKNKELHFKLGLHFEQFFNFAYGIFKVVSGVLVGSAWIGADGIYMIRRANREIKTLQEKENGENLL